MRLAEDVAQSGQKYEGGVAWSRDAQFGSEKKTPRSSFRKGITEPRVFNSGLHDLKVFERQQKRLTGICIFIFGLFVFHSCLFGTQHGVSDLPDCIDNRRHHAGKTFLLQAV